MFHAGMLLTRGAADFACLDAGAQLRSGEFEIGASKARDDAGGGEADIGAVIAIADALDHLRNFLFRERRIGTGVARFGAGVTCRDALDHSRVIGGRIHRVTIEHLFDVAHVFQPTAISHALRYPGKVRRNQQVCRYRSRLRGMAGGQHLLSRR